MNIDDTDSELTQVLKKYLLHYINFYMNKYELSENPTLIAATFLDVRTKTFGRVSEKERKDFLKIAQTYIKQILPESSQSNNTNSILVLKPRLNIFDFERTNTSARMKKKLVGLDKELYDYLNEPVKNIEPIQYWNINKDIFPMLFGVLKKLFCIPATSVPAETLFSHAGYNVWDRRNKLKPSNVNKMMVIYENYL
jgi:hypothetical protein